MSRISGGKLRGVRLKEGVVAGVRPTSSRVREALFSILGQDLSGLRFLDAFAGTGCVGIEAWSRGADVTAVERNHKAMASIKRNGAQVDANWTLRLGDVLKLAPSLGHFDLVFVDPPYAEPVEPVLQELAPLTEHTLVIEVAAATEIPEECAGLVLTRDYSYGSTRLGRYSLRLRQ